MQRMNEIRQDMARENRVTVQSITRELDEAAALARRLEQPSAMTQAITVKARLHGLIVDRKESGAPGDFAAAQTEAEVVEAIREQLGDGAADALLVLIGKRPGGRPGGLAEPAEVTTKTIEAMPVDNIEVSD